MPDVGRLPRRRRAAVERPREELASGRLADYLRRTARTDLLPRPDAARVPRRAARRVAGAAAGDAVERPRAGRPSRQPGCPGHRRRRAARHVLRITNVGYRLLRSRRGSVEPAGTSWVRLGPEYDGRPFETVEATEVPFEVMIPEGSHVPPSVEIVIDSNGGTRRIAVRVGPLRPVPRPLPDVAAETTGLTVSELLRPWAARRSPLIRTGPDPGRNRSGRSPSVRWCSPRACCRSGQGTPPIQPRLPALAVLCALPRPDRRLDQGPAKEWRPRGRSGHEPASRPACSGSWAPRLFMRLYGRSRGPWDPWSSSYWALGLFWAAIGAAVAGLTVLLVPVRRQSSEAST